MDGKKTMKYFCNVDNLRKTTEEEICSLREFYIRFIRYESENSLDKLITF